jgi:RNA polymerase sigma-70 factor (ECF subfamily)
MCFEHKIAMRFQSGNHKAHIQQTSKTHCPMTTMTVSVFEKNLVMVQKELHKLAVRLTCNEEDANDLMQETSLKALDNREKFQPGTNFKGWLYTIMRNLFINNYRKASRDKVYNDQTDNQYHINLSQDFSFDSTEEAYDIKEIHKAVHALPKEYRIPFAMHISGFKYKEIAAHLGIPIGTVKSRIFFTRQRLQQELRDFR